MALAVPVMGTSYSGFWNSTGPTGTSGAGPYSERFARSMEDFKIAQFMGKRGNRKFRAIGRLLMGATAGGTTVDSYKRLQAGQAMYDAQYGGGLRTLQTVNNAVTTTSAHVTTLQTRWFDMATGSQAYPVDLSGNGGGGKRGR